MLCTIIFEQLFGKINKNNLCACGSIRLARKSQQTPKQPIKNRAALDGIQTHNSLVYWQVRVLYKLSLQGITLGRGLKSPTQHTTRGKGNISSCAIAQQTLTLHDGQQLD